VAEANALYHALVWAKGQHLHSLIIELDCEPLVKALLHDVEDWATEARGVVLDCLDAMKEFQHLQFQHVRREGNRCAHQLAKFSETLVTEMSWIGSSPQCIRDCIESELTQV